MNHLAEINQPLIIIIAIFAALAVFICGYFIIRNLKGKIVIHLPKVGYNSGEPITGSIDVTFKKAVEMKRLYVALIGYQITEQQLQDGKTRTIKDEIYRNEMNLADAQPITAGYTQQFNFSLETPSNNTATDQAASGTGEKIASFIAFTAKAFAMNGSKTHRYEWKVEARADLPGIDVASSKIVHVYLI